MSDETIIQLIRWSELLMQVSILVPMAVVWKRKKEFPAPIRLLSWYVYLSIGCVIAAKMAAFYFRNNLLLVPAFNGGKVLLFAAVYAQILPSGRVRRVLLQATLVALLIVVSSVFYNWKIAGNIARMMQCTLLAGFALAYLEQELNNPAPRRGFQDPIWLLSVGQLLYSGGSIVGNLDTFTDKVLNSWALFFCLIISGLIFNYFLTLVFLRAQQYNLATSPIIVSN
jgi:hypothetical protein